MESRISGFRIMGMTLGEFWRAYVSTGLGKASLILFLLLIGVSIYAAVVIPPNFGTIWNSLANWQIYPKDAPPSWINLFSPVKYAPEYITAPPVHVSSNMVTLSFTIRDGYDVPWRDLFIVINPPLRGMPLIAYITVKRPDGKVLGLGPFQLSAGPVTEVGTVYQVEGEVIGFYQSNYGYPLTIPSGLSAIPYIFMAVSKGRLTPLKGVYYFNVTIMPVSGALPSISSGSRPVEVALEGQVYGLMGTDAMGHDLWLGLLAGFPISLEIGVVYAIIVTVLAIAIGLSAGYLGGAVDEVLSRLTDFTILLPAFVILVVLSVLLRLNIWDAMLYLAILSWGGSARIIRAMAMQIRSASYVELARIAGASNMWILRNHILPQITPYTLYLLVVNVPGAILTLAGLNFLNLAGVGYPTWGTLLYYAEEYGALESGIWWWVIPPGLLIAFVAVTFIITALAIEPIVNPRLRR